LVLIAAVLVPLQASAWIETSVRSHQARVEVAKDGRALVRHELVLKVRGGPMKFLEIAGIGTEIEALPDAVVRSATEGSASKWPLSIGSLEDGGLRLKIGADRGIRGGSYLFDFAYKIDLEQLGLITRGPGVAEIRWIGPRLSSGVDSAKVVFVVPRAATAPRLVPGDGAEGEVLLGELRRGEDWDEVELVRAHLAIGEPAVWKIEVAADALSDVALSGAALRPIDGSGEIVRNLGGAVGLHEGAAFVRRLIGGGLSFVFGLLLFIKARWISDEARRKGARLKPLLPGAPWLRAVYGASFVLGGVHFALQQRPWVAVAMGVAGLFSAAYLLPSRIVRPRGPGHWVQLDKSGAAGRRKWSKVQLFETTNARGFVFFTLLIVPLLVLAYRILPTSNYLSMMIGMFSLLLVPLFWTGRVRDLPGDAVEQARPWLSSLERAFDPKLVQLQLWGRMPQGGEREVQGETHLVADESRLRLLLAPMPTGLRSLEISFEEGAGASIEPCVLLRVTDDSVAKDCLPPEVPWQRGRSSDERVALLRPTAPTRAQLLRLLRSLVTNLRAAAQGSEGADGRSNQQRRSSARGETTLKRASFSPEPAM
jgi:hypothetical protein